MTQTARKASNGRSRVYHEFATPAPAPAQAPIIVDQQTLAQLPVWRIVVLLGAIALGVATVTWRVAAERATISEENIAIKADLKALTASVSEFRDSVKELSANLRHLSGGTWTHYDMQAFCKNMEAQNARAGFKCPAINPTTGTFRHP